MAVTAANKGACCGFALSHVATTTALIYFFVLTVLAAVVRRQIGVLAAASTTEGNDIGLWTNPLIVSLACAVVFAVFDLACVALLWLLSRSHDEPTTALKFTWAGTLFLTLVWLTLCAVGSYLSFGEVKTEIEQACKTLDSSCFSTHEAIQWGSIIMEVLGLFFAGWMIVSTGSNIHPGFFHGTTAAAKSGPSAGRGKARTDEEALLADGGSSCRTAGPGVPSGSGDAYSLGRYSRKHRSSRRTKGGSDDYSLRKDVSRGRSKTRVRTSSVARREIRHVQEEAERAMRSLSHARRAAERKSATRRSTSKSGRGGWSDDERDALGLKGQEQLASEVNAPEFVVFGS